MVTKKLGIKLINTMAKATKKAKAETGSKSTVTKETLLEFVQDIHQKANQADESRIHCAIAMNQILTNADYVGALNDESKQLLKEVWHKLKSEGIQLVDPPLLFGLPEGFDQEELAN